MPKFSNIPLTDILLSAILISLPVSIKATNYILVLLVVCWLFSVNTHIAKKKFKSVKTKLLLINILPFLFICISLIYTEAPYEGLKGVEKYLPLLAFPFIFHITVNERSNQFLLRVFAISVLIMVGVCTIYALYNFIFLAAENQLAVGDNYSKIISKWNALSNTSLMQPFSINPIYMSLYISFAMFIFVLDSHLKPYLRILLTIILIAFQLLISSRIGMGALFLSLIVYVFLKKENVKQYYKVISAALVITFVSSFLLIFYNPILQKRFITDFKKFEIPSDVSGWNGLNIRNAIWRCSLELFSESPYVGYGVGAQYAAREGCYKTYTFYGPFGELLNCHNQYLEYSLIGGILLLSLFLFQLFSAFHSAFKSHSSLHIIFLVLFVITCLGESLLETHKGIVFFSFFNSLFLFNRNNTP